MKILGDITIYYNDLSKIDNAPLNSKIRRLPGFICDLYYFYLDSYKPPKTSRICIQLGIEESFQESYFFGSICSIFNKIDEDRYFKDSDRERSLYILDIIHQSIMKAAVLYGWDKNVFENAFKRVLENNFEFKVKLSEKVKGGIRFTSLVEKDLNNSYLKIIIDIDKESREIVMITKQNVFCYDNIFFLGKKLKWLNNDQIGLEIKKMKIEVCYTISKNELESNLKFTDGNIYWLNIDK